MAEIGWELLRAAWEAGKLPPRALEISAALGHGGAQQVLGPPRHFLVSGERRAPLPWGRSIQLGKYSPPAEFTINHWSVCPRHCVITASREGGVFVKDSKSLEGTYVNGEEALSLAKGVVLSPGDVLRLGAVSFRYECTGAPLVRIPTNPSPVPGVRMASAGGKRLIGPPLAIATWIADLGREAALRAARAVADAAAPYWNAPGELGAWTEALFAAAAAWIDCPCERHLGDLRVLREGDPLGGERARGDESLARQDEAAYKTGLTTELGLCFAIRALALIATTESGGLAHELQQSFDGAVSATSQGVVQESLRRTFLPWLLAAAEGGEGGSKRRG